MMENTFVININKTKKYIYIYCVFGGAPLSTQKRFFVKMLYYFNKRS